MKHKGKMRENEVVKLLGHVVIYSKEREGKNLSRFEF